MTKPTVGRVVHFYSDAVKANPPGAPSWNGRGFNGQEAGPYVAVVTQVFPDAAGNVKYANLKVFPPFAPPFDEGSVSEGAEASPGRFWEWPPLDLVIEAATIDTADLAPAAQQSPDDQIKIMVERFLSWRLPDDFAPDAGISFKAEFNEGTANPMRHEPVGTNLLTYTQAEALVRHMVGGFAKFA